MHELLIGRLLLVEDLSVLIALVPRCLKRSRQSLLTSDLNVCLRKHVGLSMAALACWFGAVVRMLKMCCCVWLAR